MMSRRLPISLIAGMLFVGTLSAGLLPSENVASASRTAPLMGAGLAYSYYQWGQDSEAGCPFRAQIVLSQTPQGTWDGLLYLQEHESFLGCSVWSPGGPFLLRDLVGSPEEGFHSTSYGCYNALKTTSIDPISTATNFRWYSEGCDGERYEFLGSLDFTMGGALPACMDGMDNDGDGARDEADRHCSLYVSEAPECQDGLDNDADGTTDGADTDCVWPGDETERPEPLACMDGIDNDHDGHIDYGADPECVSRDDSTEGPTACSDGIDNDGDGRVDMNDRGCATEEDDDEGREPPRCFDGRDNDGDGYKDWPLDFGCYGPIDDSEEQMSLCPLIPDRPKTLAPSSGPTPQSGGTGGLSQMLLSLFVPPCRGLEI